jgi:hypothetical protein
MAATGGLAGLSACDCRAKVMATSTVLGDVRVQIASGGGLCGGAPALGDFEVYRGPDATELVWQASFAGSSQFPAVAELKYGSAPAGFTESQPALPLHVDDTIEFRVHGPGFRGGTRLAVTAGR